MPRFDRTGPLGRGSMTGRGIGKCIDNANSENFAYGRSGRGFGNRYGFGRNQKQFSNVSEKTIVENEINTLKDQLSSLEKQLNDLKDD